MKKRKVLRVMTGEFLFRIYPNKIETTGHIKNALDISNIPFSVLDNITHNLYNAGYRELKVLEVD